MANYTFETITDAQAAGFTSADTLTFTTAGLTGAQVSVAFRGAPTFPDTTPAATLVTVGSKTVVFSTALQDKGAVLGQISLPDGSMLYIGDGVGNSVTGTSKNDGLFGND